MLSPPTSPWCQAQDLLHATLPEGRVERIHPGHDGEFQAEVDVGDERLWVKVLAGRLAFVRPDDDAGLPLAALLPAWRAARPVAVLSWRSGRRLTVRLGTGVVWTGVRRGCGARLRRHHALAASVLRGTDVDVATLVGCDPSLEAICVAHRVGAPPRPEHASAPIFRRVGAALRVLQDGSGNDSRVPRHTARLELLALDRLSERWLFARGCLPPGLAAVREQLQELERHEEAPSGLAHRELHDGRLLVQGAHVTLLHFEALSRADTALDAASLTAHLSLRVLQSVRGATENSARACREALLQGLDRNAEDGFARRLVCYRAAALLRLALTHGLRPAWSHLAEPLVALAERSLGEG